MAKALDFPKHKHPPVRAGLLQAAGSAASQASAAGGEDQGGPSESTPQTDPRAASSKAQDS